ncbi:hypothetical protein [Nibrella viscosa]
MTMIAAQVATIQDVVAFVQANYSRMYQDTYTSPLGQPGVVTTWEFEQQTLPLALAEAARDFFPKKDLSYVVHQSKDEQSHTTVGIRASNGSLPGWANTTYVVKRFVTQRSRET